MSEMAMRPGIVANSKSNASYQAVESLDDQHEIRSSSWFSLGGLFALIGIIMLFLTSGIIGMIIYNTFVPVRASCHVDISFPQNNCASVQREILQRVRGQHTGAWHDPHNNGSYALVTKDTNEFLLNRVSGTGSSVKYTDIVTFNFASKSTQQELCHVTASSTSTVFSILDFGTNFCNILDLFSNAREARPFTRLSYTYLVGKCALADTTKCYTV